MKLNIPFYLQTTKMNCGSVVIQMILSFFGNELDVPVIEKAAEVQEGKGVTTIKLAIASSKLGYKTEFYSKSLYFNEELLKLDFYKNYGDLSNIEESKKLVEKAKEAGVLLEEKNISLDSLLKKINENCVAIVLVDWSIIIDKPERGYVGHFIPVVGYDEKSVYIHNHGFLNPTAFLEIPHEKFDKARKANGTDEDIIFVYRP